MKKFTSLILIFFSVSIFASELPASKAVGVFLTAGVGPRLPIGSFATSTDLGYGFNLDVSYTDSDYLPFFAFARIGYEQYPGSQSFYQETDYSNFSTQAVPLSVGIRYYLSPIAQDIILLIPVVEASISYTYVNELHEFKVDSGRNNFRDEFFKFGFSAGAGVSMFLLEIMANYNYLESNQYISLNLNVRLPLLVTL